MKICNTFFTKVSHTFQGKHVKGIRNTFNNLLSKVSGIKNNNENLRTQPAKYFKCFSNDYDSNLKFNYQTGFLSHFGRYQEPAIFIHGSGTHYENGKGIVYFKGITVDNKNLAGESAVDSYLSIKDFVATVKKDFSLDLHRTGNTGTNPLHLICCFSGSFRADSIAGELSRELERSVVTYGDNSPVEIFGKLIDTMDERTRVYSPDKRYPNGILKPLKPIIHFPDNKPGQIRE